MVDPTGKKNMDSDHENLSNKKTFNKPESGPAEDEQNDPTRMSRDVFSFVSRSLAIPHQTSAGTDGGSVVGSVPHRLSTDMPTLRDAQLIHT